MVIKMGMKQFVWLKMNLGRYNFETEEARKIKSRFDSVTFQPNYVPEGEMPPVLKALYDQFVGNFYNNIIGSKYGLADRGITTNELDCCFVFIDECWQPIECCKAEHPDKVIEYVRSCAAKMPDLKNRTQTLWRNNLTTSADRLEQIKSSGKPSTGKMVCSLIGGAISGIWAFVYIIMMMIAIMAHGDSAISALPLLSTLEEQDYISGAMVGVVGGLTAFLLIIIIFLGVLGIIFAVKETKLINMKKRAEKLPQHFSQAMSVLENVGEQNFSSDIQSLSQAAQNGSNCVLPKMPGSVIVDNFKRETESNLAFFRLSDRERTAVPVFAIICDAVAVIIMAALLFRVYLNGNTNDYYYDYGDYGDSVETFEEVTEEVTEAEWPAEKHYAVITADCTWDEAMEMAQRYYNGTLAVIASPDEYADAVAALEYSELSIVWIGAQKSANDPYWDDSYWNDGRKVNKSSAYWLSGEPSGNDSGYEENYLVLHKISRGDNPPTWYLNDISYEGISALGHNEGKLGYLVEYYE